MISTGSVRERPACKVKGCKRLARFKGISYKNKPRFGPKCDFHTRKENRLGSVERSVIPNMKCKKCGWDKAPCNRSRIDRSKPSTPDNIEILCPNCTRIKNMKQMAKGWGLVA